MATTIIPVRGAAMHPALDHDVAVGWRSPFLGRVKVEGRVGPCDAGGGVVWSLVKASIDDQEVLSQGSLNRGDSQTIPVDPTNPLEIWVQPGDIVFLAVDPNGRHEGDMTAVEYRIIELGGQKRTWNLAEDVADSIHASNPHTDRFGNADVWGFYAVPLTPPP
jgi:hypothetical protein